MKNWKQSIIDKNYRDILDEKGSRIAVVARHLDKNGKEKQASKDNAKLISASPELLAACEYVVKYHREHDSGEGELFGLDFVTTCISAIRNAKGL